MNKVAFIKDPHLMFGFSNNIRKPLGNGSGNSWEKNIYRKLEFIADRMIASGIYILIFSGDVFDRSKRSDWSFNKWIKHKKCLEEIFLSKGIEIYSVQGNHDMFDGKDTLEETIFGEMVEYGIIKHLTNNPLEFQTQNGLVKIFGNDYSFTKEKQKLKFSDKNIESENIISMLVSHTNISPNEDQLVDFTYQELAENFRNINVHLCGHYHLGFESTIINDITFINPWNMTRVTREYQVRMDNHTPEVVFLDLDRYNNTSTDWIEHVVLPHVPFHEAFNEEVVSVLKENQKFKFFENSSNGDISLDGLINEDLDDNQLLSVIINSVLVDKSVNEKQALLNKALQYLV
jgi:DNA repair exonuclease SbcCD nuclease subunit